MIGGAGSIVRDETAARRPGFGLISELFLYGRPAERLPAGRG